MGLSEAWSLAGKAGSQEKAPSCAARVSSALRMLVSDLHFIIDGAWERYGSIISTHGITRRTAAASSQLTDALPFPLSHTQQCGIGESHPPPDLECNYSAFYARVCWSVHGMHTSKRQASLELLVIVSFVREFSRVSFLYSESEGVQSHLLACGITKAQRARYFVALGRNE